jgi:hypothetical protein
MSIIQRLNKLSKQVQGKGLDNQKSEYTKLLRALSNAFEGHSLEGIDEIEETDMCTSGKKLHTYISKVSRNYSPRSDNTVDMYEDILVRITPFVMDFARWYYGTEFSKSDILRILKKFTEMYGNPEMDKDVKALQEITFWESINFVKYLGYIIQGVSGFEISRREKDRLGFLTSIASFLQAITNYHVRDLSEEENDQWSDMNL